jgi:hypothetical protein
VGHGRLPRASQPNKKANGSVELKPSEHFWTLDFMSRALGKNTLDIKLDLIRSKNKGDLFIPQAIIALDQHDPFDMYYYLLRPPKDFFRNAFPVPPSCLVGYKCKQDQLEFNRHYFHHYYRDDIEMHSDDFYLSFNRVYRGSEWIWLYRFDQ